MKPKELMPEPKRNKIKKYLCKGPSSIPNTSMMKSPTLVIVLFLCCVILDRAFGSKIPLFDSQEPDASRTHVRRFITYYIFINFGAFCRISQQPCCWMKETELLLQTLKKLLKTFLPKFFSSLR